MARIGCKNKLKSIDIGSQYDCEGGSKMLMDTTIKETTMEEMKDIIIYPNPASNNVQVSVVQPLR